MYEMKIINENIFHKINNDDCGKTILKGRI